MIKIFLCIFARMTKDFTRAFLCTFKKLAVTDDVLYMRSTIWERAEDYLQVILVQLTKEEMDSFRHQCWSAMLGFRVRLFFK